MNHKIIEHALLNAGWRPFYSDNYWIPEGGGDYSGLTKTEAYVRVRYPNLSPQDTFTKVMEVEFELNQNKRLYVHGKTFPHKEQLKSKFDARYDGKKKEWYVKAEMIKSEDFHRFCYSKSRNFSFSWE